MPAFVHHDQPPLAGLAGWQTLERRPGCHTTVMSTSWNLTTAVQQEEDWYVASVFRSTSRVRATQALRNLTEAVEFSLEEVDDLRQHVTATPLVTSFQVPGAA
jgi:methyl coenzyme M reductase subunit C-like uncharacterized protein (methanogenesis marker protein 7)